MLTGVPTGCMCNVAHHYIWVLAVQSIVNIFDMSVWEVWMGVSRMDSAVNKEVR